MQIRLLLLLTLLPFSILAQPIIHHQIIAQIEPDKNSIEVIDTIQLATEQVSQQPQKLSFVIHAGSMLNLQQKNIRLEKISPANRHNYFPEFSSGATQQGVPVDVYTVELPAKISHFTLSYQRKINHRTLSDETNKLSIVDSAGLISQSGVYLAAESLWYPRFNDELITFRLSVRLPANWKSVSQGTRIYQENEKTYHLDTWEELHAQNDIYLIASEFIEYQQKSGKIATMAFLRTADEALAKKYLDATAQYLEMYQTLFDDYPYSKFALVENFWQTGFGMPSFTLLGSQIIRFPFILYSSYPHELLHNWFGNSIYVDYSKGNWSEGLTSYLADHLIKEQRGRATQHRQAVLQKYTNFTQNEGDFALSNFVSRTDAVTEAVGYGKTLMLFHMLRLKLGDKLFRDGIKQFYQKHQFSTASYQDIEKGFSEIGKRDLSAFFQTWVNRVGAPSLKIDNVAIKKSPNDEYQLQLKLVQTQNDDAFPIDVPIVVTLENNGKAFQKTIHMNSKNRLINLSFKHKPLRLDIDPEFDVFRRLDFLETPPSLSQIFGAPSTLIILPSQENKPEYQAYLKLAKTWQTRRNQNIEILDDNKLTKFPSDKSIWILGKKNIFRDHIKKILGDYNASVARSTVRIKQDKLDTSTNSIVLVGRNPKNRKLAIGFISADNVSAISGLGRKLPHYGKYSYLGFEGTAPNNVLKGQWSAVRSPLIYQFGNKSEARGKLIERQALITH